MVLMSEPAREDRDNREADAEIVARRRRRSVALGIVLGAIVLIFYVLTIVKLGPAIFERPL